MTTNNSNIKSSWVSWQHNNVFFFIANLLFSSCQSCGLCVGRAAAGLPHSSVCRHLLPPLCSPLTHTHTGAGLHQPHLQQLGWAVFPLLVVPANDLKQWYKLLVAPLQDSACLIHLIPISKDTIKNPPIDSSAYHATQVSLSWYRNISALWLHSLRIFNSLQHTPTHMYTCT